MTTAIIQQPALKQQQHSWQQALREIITDPRELLSLLDLDPSQIPWNEDKQFPLRVPKSFIARMKKGDPHDPLLRQVLTLQEESQFSNGFTCDPLKESEANPVPGLLHKFHGRVLLTFSPSCAIHCRYCFRRHFPYTENHTGRPWMEALQYIANHPEIVEVILSGGDPLMNTNETIVSFLRHLAPLQHVRLLRIHTRLPVVIPERIEPGLLQALKSRFQIIMVYHINHPNEIIPAIAEGAKHLKQQEITVLNQTVLLKGVNDNVECLQKLSYDLFAAGIMPYYIHLLDKVHGAAHFDLEYSTIQSLQHGLRERLPGYLVPQFVQERPHSAYKMPFNQL